jgi:hypothetical protein
MNKHVPKLIWIPLWVDKWIFGSTRIELAPDERSVWLDLLLLASRNEGHIRANEGVPYLNSQLAGLLVVSEELLMRTIDKCIQYGKVERMDDNTLFVVKWRDYQLSKRHQRRINKIQTEKNNTNTNHNNIHNTYTYTKGLKGKTDIMSSKKDIAKRDVNLQCVIDYANNRGFSLQGSQQNNRRFAYNLLRKKGLDGLPLGIDLVKKLIDIAVACRKQPYAPQINDFKQLFYKWQDLLSFVDKEKKQYDEGGRIG